MKHDFMVLYDDSGGACRAWASGMAKDMGEVRKRAAEELVKYVNGKRELGESMYVSDFTRREVDI